MATSPEVKIKISGDAKGFDAAIKGAQGTLKRLGGDLGRLQQLAAKALNLGGLGGAASIAGLASFSVQLARTAKDLTTLANVSDTSVENFQRLAFGARQVGIEQDKLADIFKDTQDKVGDFLETGGGALADFFENIAPKVGVTAAQFRNLSGPQALQLYVSSLEKANLSSAQMTFYLEAIASDSARLLPLLRNNGEGFARAADEADRLGAVIGQDLIQKSLEFEKNLERLRTLSKSVAVEFGSVLVPALNRLAEEFLDTRQAGLGFFEALIGIGLSNPFRTAEEQVKSLTEEINSLQEAQSASTDLLSPEESTGAVEQRIERLSRLRQFYELQVKRGAQEEVKQEDQKAGQILSIEQKLLTARTQLGELRAKQSKKDNEEELKGAERLRDALRSAWQASVDGARAARKEAQDLLQQASDARGAGVDQAAERRRRGLTPEQASFQASQQAEQLRSQANFAASSAVSAAFNKDAAKAQKLAADAIKLAERAQQLSGDILNDNEAATLLEQLGVIKEDALKAQALVKQNEAKQLDEQAVAQNEQLNKIEARIKVLKTELEKPVSIQADITAAESEVKKLQGELDKLVDKTVTVTVNTVAAGAAPEAAPGFAGGGFTGPGGKYQPAGIVHAGEFVLRQEVVRQAGMRRMLERLNRYGADALQGYADGGFVGGVSSTPVHLHWPDGTETKVSVRRNEADALLRDFQRAALKRGGRK